MSRRLSLVAVMALVGTLIPVAPAGAGGTCHEAPKPFDARTRTVPMEKLCFVPVVVRVPRGATVTWVNRDPRAYPHTVTGVGEAWGSYDEILNGGKVSYRFSQEGVFPYFCVVHPGMTGAVVVGDGVGNGSAAPATLVPSSTSDKGGGSGGESESSTEPAAAVSTAWSWIGVVLAGGAAFALAWWQGRRRTQAVEPPAA